MTDFPHSVHQIIYTRDIASSGISDKLFRRAIAQQQIIPIYRGAYVSTDRHRTRHELYRLKVIAAATLAGDSLVVSHESAAYLHDLSLLGPPPRHVHFICEPRRGGGKDSRRHLHSTSLDDANVVVIEGIRVTDINRTISDGMCAATDFAHALALGDSGFRRAGAELERVAAFLERPNHGVTQARMTLGHVNPLAENAGESWGRALMIQHRLPAPRLQHKFFTHDGLFVGRTDYDWDGLLVGEFDGKRKYLADRRPGESIEDCVIREKCREDELRRLGILVIRWMWDDLRTGRMVQIVRQGLIDQGLL